MTKINWKHKKGEKVGYKSSLPQSYSKYTAAGRSVSNLAIVLSSGMAVASWTNPANTASAKTQWYYLVNTTAGAQWVAATRDYQNVGLSATDSYNVPSDALAVDVYVVPVSSTFTYQWQTHVKKVEKHKVNGHTYSRTYYVYTTHSENRSYFTGSPSHIAGGVATDAAATPQTPSAPVLSASLDGQVTVELSSASGDKLVAFVGVYVDGAWGNHLGGKTYGPYASGAVDVVGMFQAARGHAYKADSRQQNTVLGVYSDYSSFSDVLEMPPLEPSGLAVSSLSANAFMASWTKEGYTGDGFELRWAASPEGMTLDNPPDGVESTTVTGGATTYSGTLAAGTWYFCVRATSDAGDSGFTEPARVVLGLVPAAPTLGTIPAYVTQGGDVALSWTYNNTDGSSQNAYQVGMKVDGGSWSSVASGSTAASSAAISLSGIAAGSSVKLRVRTQGATGDWSEWAESPSISIDAPLMVTLTVDDPPTIPLGMAVSASADVRMWHLLVTSDEAANVVMPDGSDGVLPAGSVAFEGTFQAGEEGFDARSMDVELDFADSSFANGVSYTARLDAISAHGLTDYDTATFTPEWDGSAPMPEAFVPDPGDDLVAHVFPVCRDYGGTPVDGVYPLAEGVTLSVYRIDYDGRPLLVAEGIENTGSVEVIDEHPSFGTCTYRIAARAADGSTGFADASCTVDCQSVVLQFETGLRDYTGDGGWDGAGMVELPYNLSIDEKYAPDAALVSFIGNDDPTLYTGTQLGRTASVGTSIIATDDEETIARVRSLAGTRRRCYYRDPTGLGFWAWVVPSLRWDGPRAVQATFAVSRVMGDYRGTSGSLEG